MNPTKKLILLPDLIEKIKSDKMLFVKVAEAMNLSIGGLRNKLYEYPTHKDFTTANVLQAVREYMVLTDESYEDKELVIEEITA